MSAQKDMVRRFYDDMWNKADTSVIPELFHADFTFRGSLGPVLVGHEQFAGYVEMVTGALEGYTCEIEDMVEEGQKMVARMRFHGRHTAPFMGFAPTGERVEWSGSAHFTYRDGKIADLWVLGDVHGLRELLTSQAQAAGA